MLDILPDAGPARIVARILRASHMKTKYDFGISSLRWTLRSPSLRGEPCWQVLVKVRRFCRLGETPLDLAIAPDHERSVIPLDLGAVTPGRGVAQELVRVLRVRPVNVVSLHQR